MKVATIALLTLTATAFAQVATSTSVPPTQVKALNGAPCVLVEMPDKFQPDKRFFCGPTLNLHENILVIRSFLLWRVPDRSATVIWQFTYAGKDWLFADSIIVLSNGRVTGLPKFEGPFRKIMGSGWVNETISVWLPDSFVEEFVQAPDSTFEIRVLGSPGKFDVKLRPEAVQCLQVLQQQISTKKVELTSQK